MPSKPKTYRPAWLQAKASQPRDQREYDQRRGSSSSRGYDADWRRFRVWYLRRYPLCADHHERGELEPAIEVHHKVKVKDDVGRRLDETNVIGLCKSCHSARTARGE